MIRRYTPLKRTWLKKKARRRRELWRSGRVMEDAAGMAVLREAAFKKCKGECDICHDTVTLESGELIHKKDRGLGGSDVLDNVEFGHHACHMERDHPGPQWSKHG